MFIVGLTGGIATGKSTVLSIFKNNGISVIDADEIARKVIEPGTRGWSDLKNHFGDEIFNSDGKVNRNILAEIVFNDVEKRRKLNSITHPTIQSTMIKMAFWYFLAGHNYIVIELPLLFETGRMLTFIHKIITVTCDEDQQLERLCQRNGLSTVIAKKRIYAQMPLDKKVAHSHFVVDNSGDIDRTRKQTENIIQLLKTSKFPRYFRLGLACASLLFLYSSLCIVNYFFKMFSK